MLLLKIMNVLDGNILFSELFFFHFHCGKIFDIYENLTNGNEKFGITVGNEVKLVIYMVMVKLGFLRACGPGSRYDAVT